MAAHRLREPPLFDHSVLLLRQCFSLSKPRRAFLPSLANTPNSSLQHADSNSLLTKCDTHLSQSLGSLPSHSRERTQRASSKMVKYVVASSRRKAGGVPTKELPYLCIPTASALTLHLEQIINEPAILNQQNSSVPKSSEYGQELAPTSFRHGHVPFHGSIRLASNTEVADTSPIQHIGPIPNDPFQHTGLILNTPFQHTELMPNNSFQHTGPIPNLRVSSSFQALSLMKYVNNRESHTSHTTEYLLQMNAPVKESYVRKISRTEKNFTEKLSTQNSATPAQLSFILLKLREEMPDFFNGHHSFGMYVPDMKFESRLGRIAWSLRSTAGYQLFLASSRLALRLCYSALRVDLIKITKDVDGGKIEARWRVRGKPRLGRGTERVAIEGFSTFLVNSDGFIYLHRMDKVMPAPKEKSRVLSWMVQLSILVGLTQRPSIELEPQPHTL